MHTYLSFHILLVKILIQITLANILLPYQSSPSSSFSNDGENDIIPNDSYSQADKEFWETMNQNSMLNKKQRYDIKFNDNVCFTCPIDRLTYYSLLNDAKIQAQQQTGQIKTYPPRVTITWNTEQISQSRVIFFCRNNTKVQKGNLYLNSFGEYTNSNSNNNDNSIVGDEIKYLCADNRLCLMEAKSSYPTKYQCTVKSYVFNVNLNVVVQLQYVLLYFTGDSVKFDYQTKVEVHENQLFTVKCEVPETNPISNVNAFIDNKELKLTRLDKKTVENRMSINTYSFDVNATRSMNGKRVRCEANMKDLPPDVANSIDLKSHIIKDFTISVFYLPICVYKSRAYRTGINRSLIIECPINGSNPDVTYYKMIPPSTRTKYELIDSDLDTLRKMARYRINPQSEADFGLYECIPRSMAGTATCAINVNMGDTPNPPEQCTVQFATVSNRTFAQFSCKPGFNQGGLTSFLSIYERVDKQLKLSGRVNIDESKSIREVPYITPADEDKYYEFVIMQENNYGNSTPVYLTLGTSQETKQVAMLDSKTMYTIGGVAGGLILFVCICACCCCNDTCSSTKNDNPCCKCCQSNDHHDDDGLTYKKAPMDAVGSSNNQQTFPYNPVLDSSKSHLGFTTNLNSTSNYDYYDNTSTGLLASDPYGSRSYKQKGGVENGRIVKVQQPNSAKLLSYEKSDLNYADRNRDKDDEDDDDDDHNSEEPYMNDTDDILQLKKNNKRKALKNEYHHHNEKDEEDDDDDNDDDEDGDENDDNYSVNNDENGNENADDSLTSSGVKSSNEDYHQQSTATRTSSTTSATNVTPLTNNSNKTNKSSLFQNNINVLIGSGVESIKKSSYLNVNTSKNAQQITATNSSTLKKPNNNQQKQLSNYSTLDTRKFIKTENGLVYTTHQQQQSNTIVNNRNKSMDALMTEEDEFISKRHENDEPNHYHYAIDDQENDHYHQPQHYSRVNSKQNVKIAIPSTTVQAVNTYGSIKNINNNNNNYNNKKNLNGVAILDNNFKNELSQRLKSINKEQQQNSQLPPQPPIPPPPSQKISLQTQQGSNEIYSKNYTSNKSLANSINNNAKILSAVSAQEHLSNSTATTSISSASSCASNSDLVINNNNNNNKKENNNIYNSNNTTSFLVNGNKQPNNKNDSNSINKSNNSNNNKNYSLLKTTINISNDNNNNSNDVNNDTAMTRVENTKLNNNNINGGNSYKPPILKPKPRSNNIYQTSNLKKHLNSTSESLHNQSQEPLLALNQSTTTTSSVTANIMAPAAGATIATKETSLQTTPSTSVTDVSSTNCTPQHYTSNIMEDITSVNKTDSDNSLSNKQQRTQQQGQPMPRSRSNSSTRQQQQKVQPNQQTTESVNNVKNVNGGGLISMVNGGGKSVTTFAANSIINNKNTNMKTFATNNGENTLNKNRNNLLKNTLPSNNSNQSNISIDEEISLINSANGNISNGGIKSNKLSKNGHGPGQNQQIHQQRTLERRIVKNSEC